MVKSTIEDNRDELEYHDMFEVAAAECMAISMDDPKIKFYERLESFLEGLGKRLFLPDRHLDYECGNHGRVGKQLEKIIVPSAEVVISLSEQYVNSEGPEIRTPGNPAGLILSTANNLEIPVIHFVPKIFQKDTRYNLIEYADLNDALSSAQDFFSKVL